MDAGTAAVLGALVGSLGTIVAGIIAVVPTLRAERRAQAIVNHTALGEAIKALVREMTVQSSVLRADNNKFDMAREALAHQEALAAVGVLLPKGTIDPIRFVNTARFVIVKSKKWGPQAATAVATFLPAWYVGTMTAAQLERQRLQLMERVKADEGLDFDVPG